MYDEKCKYVKKYKRKKEISYSKMSQAHWVSSKMYCCLFVIEGQQPREENDEKLVILFKYYL